MEITSQSLFLGDIRTRIWVTFSIHEHGVGRTDLSMHEIKCTEGVRTIDSERYNGGFVFSEQYLPDHMVACRDLLQQPPIIALITTPLLLRRVCIQYTWFVLCSLWRVTCNCHWFLTSDKGFSIVCTESLVNLIKVLCIYWTGWWYIA